MPEQMIAVVRWFLLAGAVWSLLDATIFFHRVQRRLSKLLNGQGPAIMRDSRFLRGWQFLMTIVIAALWWFTGTTTGHNWLQHAGQ